MKIFRSMVFVSVMLCSPLVSAEYPFDVGELGHMRAVLEMCSRASPQAATYYMLQIKSLIGDASKDVVDKAARTDKYQQEYQSIRSELSSLTQDGLKQECTSYLGSAK